MAQGIGDRFSDIDISLSGKALLLLKPNVYVSTKVAYSRVKPKPAQVPLAEALKRPVAEWRHSVVNDFEPGVFAEYPELKTIKDSLYDAGAQFALMSGSGSSIYGIFDSVKMAEEAKKHFNVDSQYVINL
jgi:4-diphosphocytidyl-2-C-methyl-D-erythritol kinase